MKTKINVFCLAHGELEAKEVQALVKLYTTTDMFEPSYCRTQEINLFNKVNLDSPRSAGTAEMVRGAGGWTDLIWTVTTVVFIVTHPLGGDAAPPSTGKLWLQTGRGGRRASHTVTLPNTLLTGAEHTNQKVFMDSLFTKDKNTEYTFINVQKDWPVLAVLSDSSSSWKQGAIPLTRTLAGSYTAVTCFTKSIQTKNVKTAVGRCGLDWKKTSKTFAAT